MTTVGRISDQEISAADSVHDFCKSSDKAELNLQNNQLFNQYISKNLLRYLQRFNVQFDGKELKNTSTIETKVSDALNISDNRENIPTLNYNNFDEEYSQLLLEPNNRDFPFAIEVNDMTDIKFRNIVAAIFSTAYPENLHDPKIECMTYTSMLKADIVCSMNINPSNPIEGKMIASEATYYDNINTKVDNKCTKFKSIPMRLKRDHGNLFGLDEISVGTDGTDTDGMFFAYKHARNPISTKVKIDDFKNQQTIGQDESSYRYKNLFRFVINELNKYASKRQRIGGAGKRKADDSTPDITKLVKNIYKLDYNNFNNSTEDIFQYIAILLDFKRAGDQLQIKSALQNKDVFLSNDIISAAYAYYCGVPSIKTSAIGSAHKTRRLVFYNFKTDHIRVSVIDNRKYYKDSAIFHVNKLITFAHVCQEIQVASHNWVIEKQNFTQFLMRKFRFSHIYQNLQKIIEKSYFILNMEIIPNVRRQEDNLMTEMEMKNRVYQYKFILQYNIFICMMLKSLLSMSFSGEYSMVELINKQNALREIDDNDIDDVKKDYLKQQLNIYENEFLVKMAHFFDFSNDSNKEFLIKVFQYYFSNTSDSNILHDDFTADKFTESYLNKYISAIKKIPFEYNSITNIPIISDYIKIIKYPENIWRKYPLIFFGTLPDRSNINTQDAPINCKSLLLSNAKKDWFETYNHLKESIDEYHYLLTNLVATTHQNVNMMENLQIAGGGIISPKSPKSPKSSKSPMKYANSFIQSIRKDLFQKRITPYDVFIKEMKEETDIPELEVGQTVNLYKLYPDSTKEEAYKKFCKDMFEIIIVFMVKSLNIFDENGYINYANVLDSTETYKTLSIKPSSSQLPSQPMAKSKNASHSTRSTIKKSQSKSRQSFQSTQSSRKDIQIE